MKNIDTDVGDFGDSHGDCGTDDDNGESHLLHHQLTRVIIGSFYATQTELGSGFLESVYANAIAVLLRGAGITVQREMAFEIMFHGTMIGRYRADLVVASAVVVLLHRGVDFAEGL